MKHLSEEIIDFIANTDIVEDIEKQHLESCSICFSKVMDEKQFNQQLTQEFTAEQHIDISKQIINDIQNEYSEDPKEINIMFILSALIIITVSTILYFFPIKMEITFVKSVLSYVKSVPLVQSNIGTIINGCTSLILVLLIEKAYHSLKDKFSHKSL